MENSIHAETLRTLLRNPEKSVELLDVRRQVDYEAAPERIPGAAWRNPEQVNQWAAQSDAAGKRLVVYCVKGGSVSQSVAERLRAIGLDAVYLEGGRKAWIEQGGPLE